MEISRRMAMLSIATLLASCTRPPLGGGPDLGGDVAAGSPGGSLSIGLTPTTPSPLRFGDALAVAITANARAFASIYVINPQGDVVSLGENIPVDPGTPIVAPGRGVLRASAPAGRTRLLAIASLTPLAGVTPGGPQPVIRAIALEPTALTDAINAATGGLPYGTWAGAQAIVDVEGQAIPT